MDIYCIENDFLRAEIMAYGAIIKQLHLKKGEVPLVVSYASAEDYHDNPMRVGACVGRYAGRIRNYDLHGKAITITKNESILHSGDAGWDIKTWELVEHHKDRIILKLKCPQLPIGHPGNVEIVLEYRLEGSTLEIEYTAETDAPTPMNPTQHSYFCFNGLPILEHQLKIHCENRLELDENLMPNGAFTKNQGNHFEEKKAVIGNAAYDDVFIVDNNQEPIAELFSPEGKYHLRVFTDQKAVVIFVSSDINGICFETQGYPDAPNFEHFPSTLLNPGETYRQKTRYCFSETTSKAGR